MIFQTCRVPLLRVHPRDGEARRDEESRRYIVQSGGGGVQHKEGKDDQAVQVKKQKSDKNCVF